MKLSALLSRNVFLAVAVIVVAGTVIALLYKTDYVEKNGVVTVAKVTGCQGTRPGTDLNIEIKLAGKSYITKLDQDCTGEEINKYFFIKVNPEQPTTSPILYYGKEVPDCLIDSSGAYPGWAEIPACK